MQDMLFNFNLNTLLKEVPKIAIQNKSKPFQFILIFFSVSIYFINNKSRQSRINHSKITLQNNL